MAKRKDSQSASNAGQNKKAHQKKRRLRIAIPYTLVALLIIYIGFDWYNSVPYDAEQSFSQFEQPDPQWDLVQELDGTFADSAPSHGVLMYSGQDALSARLAMIDRAQHTIDMQYFLIKPDSAGAIISDALIRAAKRGVRVRFLIDDVFTTTSNEQMQWLAAYPGIEVRYYNPLSRKVWKYANYVLDPMQVNRRMHNKSLTVDGVVGVVGGRNIADEYYGISTSEIFADLDVFLEGEIIKQIGQSFDFYWNDEFAVDVNLLLGKMGDEDREAYYDEIKEKSGEALQTTYKQAVNSDYIQDIASGKHDVYPIQNAHTIVDQPAKLRHSTKGRQIYPVFANIRSEIENAKTEVFVTSPYFVPEDWGSEMFQKKAENGVNVVIVTNSLEATNHVYVHGGYYYRRPELLKAGVQLFEVRADANEVLNIPNAEGDFPHLTMHTKLFVIDRQFVIVGSPNFDPRSMYLNTEFGVVIDSKPMAENLLKNYEEGKSIYAYEVKLADEDSNENWVFNQNNPDEIYVKEPARWTRRFVAFWAHVLPFELQY